MKKIKVTLYFPTSKVSRPITYNLIRDYDLQLNILHADISLNKTGKLVVDIYGKEKNIQDGLDFVEKQGIEYKIFNKSIIWNEESCIHCGACTAVCPSDAIKIDVDTYKLIFYKEKCLICGLCVKACPLNVMNISV
jgi:ferredoxin